VGGAAHAPLKIAWVSGGGIVELCHPPGESQSRKLRIPPQGAKERGRESESRTSRSKCGCPVGGWVDGWVVGWWVVALSCLSLASHSNPISARSIATGDRPPFSSL